MKRVKGVLARTRCRGPLLKGGFGVAESQRRERKLKVWRKGLVTGEIDQGPGISGKKGAPSTTHKKTRSTISAKVSPKKYFKQSAGEGGKGPHGGVPKT